MADTTRSKRHWPHFVGISLIAMAGSVLVAGCGQTSGTSHTVGHKTAMLGSSGIKMTLSYQPSPPVSLKTVHTQVTLMASNGKPVTDAQVTMQLIMLEMTMPPRQIHLKNDGKGHYSGHSIFLMAGPWRMMTDITVKGKTMKESLTVHVSN